MSKILLLDDDPVSRDALGRFLSGRGHTVIQASREAALELVEREPPAAVVLAGSSPDTETLDLTRMLHDRGGILVLFLTARADVSDRIAALDAGADDVVVGLAAPEEVDARLRALLRRAGAARPPDVLVVGDLRVDRARHRVTRAGEEIPLTLTEFNLLEYLARRKNVALTRKEILESVWGGSVEGFTNIVDVYVNYLRKKIERADRPKLIKTVRGVGYLLEEPSEADGQPDLPAIYGPI